MTSDEHAWDDLELQARAVVTRDDGWPAWWAAAAPRVEGWVRSPTFAGRIATDEDHRREVIVLTWEKLQERDYAKLRAFYERNGATSAGAADEAPAGGRFRAWLWRVVKSIGIDYLRGLPEYVRKRADAQAPARGPEATPVPSHDYWRSIVSITSQVGALADPTEGRAEARRMLEYLDREVSPRRRRAVELARSGRSMDEVAQALGVRDADEAARVVARAEERLTFRPALELWSQGFSDDEIAERLALAGGAAAERVIKAAKELLRRSFRP